jgi:isopentenyldiphosphate isomerase
MVNPAKIIRWKLILEEIINVTKNYPRFDDGRIDYSNEEICFVLNCVVVLNNEVLLTVRGENSITYPGMVNGVSGFIDRVDLSIIDQAKNELNEELGMSADNIKKIKKCKKIIQIDRYINRQWHVFVVLVEVIDKFDPTLNWENKEVFWVKFSDAYKLRLVPGFDETLRVAEKEYKK